MSVRQVKVHGRKVWQARVAYHGLRKSAVRDSKSAARDAEAELRRELQGQHARAEQGGKPRRHSRRYSRPTLPTLKPAGRGEGRAAEPGRRPTPSRPFCQTFSTG